MNFDRLLRGAQNMADFLVGGTFNHQNENLTFTGSQAGEPQLSLFPQCSEINPYVTVMGLADRVAEAIRKDAGNLLS